MMNSNTREERKGKEKPPFLCLSWTPTPATQPWVEAVGATVCPGRHSGRARLLLLC